MSTSPVAWGDYQEFTVISPVRPEDDTREGAKAQYENWLTQKPQRKLELDKLLELNRIPSGIDDESIQAVNEWFIANVEPYEPAIPEAPGMLSSRWYSVVNDLAIHLGDIIIGRFPDLYWHFFVPRNDGLSGYQKPVIHGFTYGTDKVDALLAFDLAASIGGLGHKIALGKALSERNRREFLHTIELAGEYC